jgi:hypothetical protein
MICCTSAPWAREGARTTGTTRATHPRAPSGCEQKCYDNRRTVFRSKLTAPESRIARAPELVSNFSSSSATDWSGVWRALLLPLIVLLFNYPLSARAL